jgi:hypothetical protein
VAVAADIAGLVAPELGWDAAEVERQVAAYRALAQREAASMAGQPA